MNGNDNRKTRTEHFLHLSVFFCCWGRARVFPPSPAGRCETVRFRRRGGRPRPPADMEEGRRNGPPGASAPTEADGHGAKPTRDVEDAVPYGAVRISGAGAQTAGGASPSPTGRCEYRARGGVRLQRRPLPSGSGLLWAWQGSLPGLCVCCGNIGVKESLDQEIAVCMTPQSTYMAETTIAPTQFLPVSL